MREVTLIPKVAPEEQALPELNHGMFPQRLNEDGTPRTPKKKAEKETPARRKSTRGAATPATATATPAAAGSTAASTPAASGSATPATESKKGRPRGRYTRVSLPISTMEDLMNIQLAGGLGDVRRECASFRASSCLPSLRKLTLSRDCARCNPRTAGADFGDPRQADPAWRQAHQAAGGPPHSWSACHRTRKSRRTWVARSTRNTVYQEGHAVCGAGGRGRRWRQGGRRRG